MGQKGYISEFVNGGRIVSHGKINDLLSGFRLPGDIPFFGLCKAEIIDLRH